MKIIIALSLCFFTVATSAQIKEIDIEKPVQIGEIKMGGMFFMDCQLYDNDKYVFNFRDLNYQKITEIKSFAFRNFNDDFEEFYKLISNGISTKQESEKSIELPEGIVLLNFKKKKISFYFTDENGLSGVSQYFNQKQIDNLFGKEQ